MCIERVCCVLLKDPTVVIITEVVTKFSFKNMTFIKHEVPR